MEWRAVRDEVEDSTKDMEVGEFEKGTGLYCKSMASQ